MDTSSPYLSRRQLLHRASTAAAFFAVHNPLSGAKLMLEASEVQRKETGPRLLSLDLVSAVPLGQMKAFYQQQLRLQVVEEHADQLTIQAGLTRMTFVAPRPKSGKPFYHFAFNTPENKIVSARTR